MIGIVPGINKTFIVEGTLESPELKEGRLYTNASTGRIYLYSTVEKRPSKENGYFPIWNGNEVLTSKFAVEKYLDRDVIVMDIPSLASNIDADKKDDIIYRQRRADNDTVLSFPINEGDNMFTQCVKGILNLKQLTSVDLEMMAPKCEKHIHSYCTALNKISFMRTERWNIWMDVIFKLPYAIRIYHEDKVPITYNHPAGTFDTGIVKHEYITNSKDDFLKKIVKLTMAILNVSKDQLHVDTTNDYTVNNLMIVLYGNKPLSSQLFTRFMTLAGISYSLTIYEGDKPIFEFKE